MGFTIATAATIGKLVSNLKETLKESLNEISAEIDLYFKNGIECYINRQVDNFRKTKTFYFTDVNVDFYSIYHSVRLKSRIYDNIEVDNVNKLFKKTNHISVIGYAGSGKSMLMKHIFFSTLNHVKKIPVFIELRKLNTFEGSLNSYLQEVIFMNNIVKNDRIFSRLLKRGDFIFLFDGYDEISLSEKERRTNEISTYSSVFNKNYYILTSRPGTNIETLQLFDNFEVKPLENLDLKPFIKKQLSIYNEVEYEKKVIKTLNESDNKVINEYLKSPLLLTMFIFAFKNYPEIPDKKSIFYRNVFETLSTKHNLVTKFGNHSHDRKTKLTLYELQNILKMFASYNTQRDDYEFSENHMTDVLNLIKDKLNLQFSTSDLIYDLHVSISILILDGLKYRFPHRTLQEYFTALRWFDFTHEKKIKTLSKVVLKELRNESLFYETLSIYYEIDEYYCLKHVIIPFLENIINSCMMITSGGHYSTYNQAALITMLIEKKDRRRIAVIDFPDTLSIQDNKLLKVSKRVEVYVPNKQLSDVILQMKDWTNDINIKNTTRGLTILAFNYPNMPKVISEISLLCFPEINKEVKKIKEVLTSFTQRLIDIESSQDDDF